MNDFEKHPVHQGTYDLEIPNSALKQTLIPLTVEKTHK